MNFFFSPTKKVSATLWAAVMLCFTLASGAAAASHTVTVVGDGANASGGGTYTAGATVSISAGKHSKGTPFKKWTAQKGGVKFKDEYSGKTTFVMPDRDVVVRAEFGVGLGKKLAAVDGGMLTDDRDNNRQYKTVIIGGQRWMAENLNYVVGNNNQSRCNGDNNTNCVDYGRLYTWTTASNSDVCPTGWHLPTKGEWETLINSTTERGVAGKELKATEKWVSGGNGTDDYGFSALPGGRNLGPNGGEVGTSGYWWLDGSTAFFYEMNTGDEIKGPTSVGNPDIFASVRCVETKAVSVEKIKLPTPEARKDLTYNKGSQSAGIPEKTDEYILGGVLSGTDAETYTATAKLSEPNKYEWKDAPDKEIVNIPWSIAPKKVPEPVFTVPKNFEYDGFNKVIDVPLSVLEEYEVKNNSNIGRNAGPYKLEIALTDEKNYVWDGQGQVYSSEPLEIEWEIAKQPVTKPAIKQHENFVFEVDDEKTVEIEPLAPTKYTLTEGYQATHAGTYYARVELENEANYKWDGGPDRSYIDLEWNIDQKEPDENKAKELFGNPTVWVPYVNGIKLADITPPKYYEWAKPVPETVLKETDGGKSFQATFWVPSGDYKSASGEIIVKFGADGDNQKVDKPVATTPTHTYDGDEHDAGIVVDDSRYTLGGDISRTDASDKYITTVTLKGGYEWVKDETSDEETPDRRVLELEWSIAKAPGTSFLALDPIDKVYSTNLTLSGITLPDEYKWSVPGTSLSAGANQSFAATYTVDANHLPFDGTIIVNVTKGPELKATGPAPKKIGSKDVAPHDLVLSDEILIDIEQSDHGSLHFELFGELENDDDILQTLTLNAAGSMLNYQGKGKLEGTAAQIIEISSENYQSTKVTITFEATDQTIHNVKVNNGTGGSDYHEGETVVITANYRPGEEFVGWTTEPDDVGLLVDEDDALVASFVMPDHDVIVTAEFEDVEYQITFDPNGGEIDDDDMFAATYGASEATTFIDKKGGQLKLESLPVTTRTGYKFVGWFPLNSENMVTLATVFTGRTYVYARWTPIDYTVTWIPYDGAPVPGQGTLQKEYNYDDGIAVPPKMEKLGHHFDYWYVIVDGVETEVTFPISDFPINNELKEHVTFHAHWTPKSYTVVWYLEFEGSIPIPPTTVKYGEKIAKEPANRGTEYAFDGWYTDIKLTSPVADEDWPLTADKEDGNLYNFYAKWSKIHTITFDANGGKFETNDGVVTQTTDKTGKGGKLENGFPTPKWDGHHTLIGWFTEKTGGVEVKPTDSFGENTTLFARWKYDPPYGVTFIFVDGDKKFPMLEPINVEEDGILAKQPDFDPPACGSDCAYKFNKKWYDAETGGKEINTVTEVFKDNAQLFGRLEKVTTYLITFDANGGKFGEATTFAGKTGADKTIAVWPEEVPTKTTGDRTFDGWWTQADGGALVDQTKEFSAAATVYAHWKTEYEPLTITFNPKGGSVTPTSGTTGTNGKLASIPTPARVGYTFDGWYISETSTTKLTADHVFNNPSETTIYARWNSITITFNVNPNDGALPAGAGTTAVVGDDGTLASLPTPTPAAGSTQVFDAWYTTASGTTGTEVTTGTVFNANATVFARWMSTYTVTFSLFNGGTLPSGTATTAQTGIGGKLEMANLPTPTKTNYAFNGWFTEASGGTQVSASTSFRANTIVYAQYTPVSVAFTITFNASSGSVSPASSVTRGNGTLASIPTPTRSGWKFEGWFTAASGGDEVTLDKVYAANTTIYAQWKQIFTVTFNPSSGTVSPTSAVAGTDGKLESPPPEPVRAGYKFEGWFTASTGGTEVTEDRVYTANTTIYARWTLITYTITFDLNGVTGSNVPAPAVTGTGAKLASLPTPATRSGYTFGGWYTDASEGERVTTSTVFDGDKTVYARWTPVSYTITYSLGGGTATPANPTSYTGETPDITLVNPTRPAYEFAGWTGSNGTVKQLEVTIEQGSSGAKSYTANWTAIIYDISFDVNGGKELASATAKTAAGGRLASLPTPTRENYAFDGWFAADGSKVTTSTVFESNATIVAQWSFIYKVTFNPNGGTVTPTTANTGAGGKLASLPTPTLTEYTFIGWFTDKEEGVKVSTSTVFDKDSVLYAHWTKLVSVTVTFSAGANGTLLASVGGVPIASGASVNIGEDIIFMASPAAGYKVLSWTMNGSQVKEMDSLPMYILSGLSSATTVTVSFEPGVSVASPNREIPNGIGGEVAAIAPVKALSGVVTVGPNPVRAGGEAVIYWNGGKAVSGKLTVFDAVGGKAAVVNVRGTNKIGAWKTNGAAEGTYLIKGVLKDKNGTKVMVSQLVGVVR